MARFMAEALGSTPVSPQREVAEMAASPATHAAFKWLHSQQKEWLKQQIEIVMVPAPPFHERARAEWLEKHFAMLGLEGVRIDSAGNVLGTHAGTERDRKQVALSAHLDTVFPPETAIDPHQDGNRIFAPGISDNGAGLAALLAIASTLQRTECRHRADIIFIATAGEEGEGNLRGMRHIFASRAPEDPSREIDGGDCAGLRIGHTINVDGAGTHTVVAHALGSKRFEISIHGPGGHSWSDFGAPNAIVLLARFITEFTDAASSSKQVSKTGCKETSFNFGIIKGGTSVNSIPGYASVTLDVRSSRSAEIQRLEDLVMQIIGDAAYGGERSPRPSSPEQGNPGGGPAVSPKFMIQSSLTAQPAAAPAMSGRSGAERRSRAGRDAMVPVTHQVHRIGERPAGELNPGARILQVIRAVDSHLDIKSQMHRASTDANIPIALGLEAISIGGGGQGGGAHTLLEWFDPTGRELGLKRILLTALTLAGPSPPARTK